uniref:Pre-mRNA-splicing factor SPF27 n=1 Tax=Myxobolus squamalis TaxID=59785 RepID=A0A6B2G1G8_MYXSQ
MEDISKYQLSLPYLDKEFENPTIRKKVIDLIDEEMNSCDQFSHNSHESSEQNYLSELGKSELDRVSKSVKLNIIDLEHYEISPSSNKIEHQTDIQNLMCAVEYQNSAIQNLELLNEYACKSWRLHNFYLEKNVKQVSQQHESLKLIILYSCLRIKIQDINYKRRTSQLKIGDELQFLNDSWKKTVERNIDLVEAIANISKT